MGRNFAVWEERGESLISEAEESVGPTVKRQYQSTELLDREADILELSLSDLRRFPQILCDVTLKSPDNADILDSYVYWAWTAAFMNEVHGRAVGSPFSRLNPLIDMMLFSIRFQELDLMSLNYRMGNQNGSKPMLFQMWELFKWLNPSMSSTALGATRIAPPLGFSILDGLISKHCERLTKDGRVKRDTLPSPWRPPSDPMNGGANYHDRIQIWIHYDSADQTAETLKQINDLTRYSPSQIIETFRDVNGVVNSELKSTQNFFRVLEYERNKNVHGREESIAISSIVTTLCCLIFWDSVKPDSFQMHRNHVIDELDEALSSEDQRNTPAAYLPVLLSE